MKKVALLAMIILFVSSSFAAATVCGDSFYCKPPCKDGKDGKPGPAGPTGPAGPAGKDGLNGKDGKNGLNGKDGHNGIDGKNGIDGREGVAGKDGINGKDGAPGAPGAPGAKGDPGDVSYAQVERDQKTLATMAGIAAATRIDHAKNGGLAAGIGISAIDDAEAISIGVGKSWQSSGTIKEYVLDATAFIGTSGSEKAGGVAAALTAHF